MNEKPMPKSTQILQDWVNSVQFSAQNAMNALHAKTGFGRAYLKDSDRIDRAADYIGEILGQCMAMNAVLKNSD